MLLFAVIPSAAGFSLNGYSWPPGSQIMMRLQLNRPPVVLQDGSASWNASAANALAIWNQHLVTASFATGSGAGTGGNDGANSVFFSNTIYGDPFPSGVLAVTLNYSHTPGVFTETDVIFNNSVKWNSYRGPLQGSGPTSTYDLQRVALHEFGHVLGLDHPDQHGQSVLALMNSVISDLDGLTADDIAGARSIYGARITSSLTPPSVRSGDHFSYQITANNNPAGYTATGLPPGIQLDAKTGLISGQCPTSGTFSVDIVVQGAFGSATGRIQIVVQPLPITSPLHIEVELGDSIAYQILAGNTPVSYGATGLPIGLELNASTGFISGVTQGAGIFDVRVSARSTLTEAAANLRLVIRAPRITSSLSIPNIDVGNSVSYQITASNQPTFFTATGLPAGLRLDSATGVITGVAELSGQYHVTITAHGAIGSASGTLVVTVRSVELSDPPLKKIPMILNGGIVADPARPRLYAVTLDGLTVIDTESLSVIKTIRGLYSQGDLSISGDGNKLWVTGYYDSKIKQIDLNTLELSSTLTTSFYPNLIREGADGRLYITDYNQWDVFQLDASTGAVLSRFTPRTGQNFGRVTLETSRDRKTLYVLGLTNSTLLGKYDVAGTNSPELQQRIESADSPTGSRKIAVNPNGASVSILSYTSQAAGAKPTLIRSAADLNVSLGSFASANPPADLIYNIDGTLAFQTMQGRSRIDVFQTANGQLLRAFTLPERAIPLDSAYGTKSMVVDRTNSFFFVATTSFPGSGLYVYALSSPRSPTPAKSLLNVATRMRAQGGDNVLIGGFIINGEEPKHLVLRAIGPSLPLSGKLADPVLEIYDSNNALVAQNDNWNAHRAEVLATGLPPSDEHEAVATVTLPPGSYTAVVRGINDGTGVALVEAYDLNPNPASKLANISTRGKVETGDNVMIGGFIIGGEELTGVIVRAIGPSLSAHGVSESLSDPMLEVYDGNGALLAQDDDWRMYQEQQLIDSGLAPTDDREAAMLLILQPGAYTAIVRGKRNGTGVGLVEVYNLE